jgi:hypothetical protein
VAHQPGDSNYLAALDVAQSFTIGNGKADQTITFAPLGNKTMAQSPFTVSATASSGLTASFTTTTASVCTSSKQNGVTITLVGPTPAPLWSRKEATRPTIPRRR